MFESLQDENSIDDYEEILDRLVCTYIRMIDLEDQLGENEHGLRLLCLLTKLLNSLLNLCLKHSKLLAQCRF